MGVLFGLQYPREDGQTALDRQPAALTETMDPAPANLTREAQCLHLNVAGERYGFNLRGGGPLYAIDPLTGDRWTRFSPEDAGVIADTLRAAGHDTATIMNALFGLRMGDIREMRDSASPSPAGARRKPEPSIPVAGNV